MDEFQPCDECNGTGVWFRSEPYAALGNTLRKKARMRRRANLWRRRASLLRLRRIITKAAKHVINLAETAQEVSLQMQKVYGVPREFIGEPQSNKETIEVARRIFEEQVGK